MPIPLSPILPLAGRKLGLADLWDGAIGAFQVNLCVRISFFGNESYKGEH